MGTVATVQARIDAQQDFDAIVYGLRNVGGSNVEIVTGCEVASRLLGVYVGWNDNRAGWQLKRAKKVAAEALAEANAAVKAVGTKRQLRLALAA